MNELMNIIDEINRLKWLAHDQVKHLDPADPDRVMVAKAMVDLENAQRRLNRARKALDARVADS